MNWKRFIAFWSLRYNYEKRLAWEKQERERKRQKTAQRAREMMQQEDERWHWLYGGRHRR